MPREAKSNLVLTSDRGSDLTYVYVPANLNLNGAAELGELKSTAELFPQRVRRVRLLWHALSLLKLPVFAQVGLGRRQQSRPEAALQSVPSQL